MFDFVKNELFFNIGCLIDRGVFKNDARIVCFGIRHYTDLSVAYLIGAGISKDRILIIDNSREESKHVDVVAISSFKVEPGDIFLIADNSRGEFESKWKTRFARTEVYYVIKIGRCAYRLGGFVRRAFPSIYNMWLEGPGYYLYCIKHGNIVREVSRVRRLKNRYSNQRCFILGNGPSLQQIDFSMLEHEYVFGVNQVMSWPEWEKARINFWACFDGDLLGMWADSQFSFMDKMKQLDKKNIMAFVPIEARYYCKRYGFDRMVKLFYLSPKLQFINLDSDMKLNRIDISRFMMQPYNVVIGAINIALYLGFKEIYLVGCDQSVIVDELRYFFEEKNSIHAYSGVDESGDAFKERIKRKGVFFEIKTQLTQLMQFRLLSEYCRRNCIKLVNLTPKSLIASIDTDTLENVLS